MLKNITISFLLATVLFFLPHPVDAQKPGPGKGSLTFIKRSIDQDATPLRSIIEKDRLFVVTQSKGVFIFRIVSGDSLQPVANNSSDIGLLTGGIVKRDNFLYVTDNLNGILVFDVSADKLEKVFEYKTATEVWDLVIKDDILFAAEAAAGLSSYQLDGNGSFTPLSSYKASTRWSWAWRTKLVNDSLLVVDKDEGIKVFDVSNPANARYLASFKTGGIPKDIIKDGTRLFVADGPEGLKVYSLNSAGYARLIESVESRGDAQSILKSGKYFFLASGNDGIYILSQTGNEPLIADFRTKETGDIISITKRNEDVYASSTEGILIYKYNSPPIITKINQQTVNENETLVFTRTGYDPDSAAVIISAENLPDGAEWSIDSASFRWTPTFEQSGRYRIYFAITEDTEAALYDLDTVTVVVNHVNRVPAFAEIEALTVDENKELTFQFTAGTDPDREDDGKLVHFARELPKGASFDTKTLKLTWTPTYDQSGTYTAFVGVKDPSGLEAFVPVNITVNHVNRAPVLAEIGAKSVNEAATLAFIVKWSDPDTEDQEKLTIEAIGLPEGSVFTPAAGEFSWVPTYEQSGTYRVKFVVSDSNSDGLGTLTDEEEITITVNHVSRTPLITALVDQATKEDEELSFTISTSDPDVEDFGKLVISGVELPKGSVLTDSTFTWKPDYFQAGSYPIGFVVTEPSGLNARINLKLTVENVNRNPVIEPVASVLDASENTAFSYQFKIADPDLEKLTITLAPLPDGAAFDAEKQLLSWTPSFEQSGNYDMTIRAADPLGGTDETSFSIAVVNVNRLPVFTPLAAQTVAEDKLLQFTVFASDPDRQTVSLDALNVPAGAEFNPMTGMFTWTPSFEQSGDYAVTFSATDEEAARTEMMVKLTVTNVNRLPVVDQVNPETVDENMPVRVLVVAPDPDGQIVRFSGTNLPAGSSIDAASGVFEWTPSYEQAGQYTVTLTATDPENGASGTTLLITVQNVNRMPEFSGVTDQTVAENSTLNYKVTVSDPDKHALTLALNGNLPTNASFDPVSGTFTFRPDYTQAGTYGPFDVTATDPEGAVSSASFIVNVTNTNRKAVLTVSGQRSVTAGGEIKLMVSATDADEESLVLSAGTLPSGASFNPGSGEFSWTTAETQSGSFTVEFSVSDGIDVVKESVSLTVNPKPAPVQPPGGGQ